MTNLPERSHGSDDKLSADQVSQLVEDAKHCFFLMNGASRSFPSLVGRTTHPRFEYIAAALAILRGYYRKQNGAPNFCGAARGCGHTTDTPRVVSDWVTRLQRLAKCLSSVREDGEMALSGWHDDARRRQATYEERGEVKRVREAVAEFAAPRKEARARKDAMRAAVREQREAAARAAEQQEELRRKELGQQQKLSYAEAVADARAEARAEATKREAEARARELAALAAEFIAARDNKDAYVAAFIRAQPACGASLRAAGERWDDLCFRRRYCGERHRRETDANYGTDEYWNERCARYVCDHIGRCSDCSRRLCLVDPADSCHLDSWHHSLRVRGLLVVRTWCFDCDTQPAPEPGHITHST